MRSAVREPTPAPDGARSRTVDLGGQRLHLLERGERGGQHAPLLLLHGTAIDSAALSFGPSLDALAAGGRRVIAPDWPGYGRSPSPADRLPPTTEELGDLLRRLLDAEHLARVDLLGFSMGAAVALQLALEQPERVGRLVLVSAYGLGGKQHLPLLPWLALRTPGFNRALLYLITRHRPLLRLLLRWLITVGGPPLSNDLLAEVQRQLRRHGPKPDFVWWLRHELRPLRHRTNLLPQLERVRPPTLLLHGHRDLIIPAWRSRRAARLIPRVQLQLLPCGHWLPRERREDFERVVTAWLAAGDPPG